MPMGQSAVSFLGAHFYRTVKRPFSAPRDRRREVTIECTTVSTTVPGPVVINK
jgi:hypothetical protein